MDDMNKFNQAPGGAPSAVFTPEFKINAVARLKACDNVTALALELGVRRNQLYKWEKRLDALGPEKAFRPQAGRPPAVEEDELTRLRRENQRLAMENTILKKAEAYFARRKR
jgi:transposase